MALAHLTVAGVVEFALTVGVIAYLQRANVPILRINHADVPRPTPSCRAAAHSSGWRWALIGLGVLVVLTPLGLLAPGGAFGEDAPERPRPAASTTSTRCRRGLAHYAGFWHTRVFGGYGFGNGEHPIVGYIVSAVVGIAVIAVASARDLRRRAIASARPRRRDDALRRRAGVTTRRRTAPDVAAAARGRAVPVRLHRQAQQGQLRRQDDRRRVRR